MHETQVHRHQESKGILEQLEQGIAYLFFFFLYHTKQKILVENHFYNLKINDLQDRQMTIRSKNCTFIFIYLLQQLKKTTEKLQQKHMPGITRVFDLRSAEPIQPKKRH